MMLLTVSHGLLFNDSWYAAALTRRRLSQPHSGETPAPKPAAAALGAAPSCAAHPRRWSVSL